MGLYKAVLVTRVQSFTLRLKAHSRQTASEIIVTLLNTPYFFNQEIMPVHLI